MGTMKFRKPPGNKLRKGSYVALIVTHSSQSLEKGRTEYTDISLAMVHAATRDGYARYVIMAGSTHPVKASLIGIVRALVDYQPQAAKLFAATPHGGKAYATKEEIRAALEEF